MLDCLAVPQPGDPFVIPKPNELYAALIKRTPGRLRIGWSTEPLMGMEADAGVCSAIARVAQVLAGMGHDVAEESPQFGGLDALRSMMDVYFFGFDLRLASYAKRTGRVISRETLEPVTFAIYEHAKAMKPEQFFSGMASTNAMRRKLGAYFTRYDVWLSPTAPRTSEPWGNYNFGRTDVAFDEIAEKLYRGFAQFTAPHNTIGTPAISLPLATPENPVSVLWSEDRVIGQWPNLGLWGGSDSDQLKCEALRLRNQQS